MKRQPVKVHFDAKSPHNARQQQQQRSVRRRDVGCHPMVEGLEDRTLLSFMVTSISDQLQTNITDPSVDRTLTSIANPGSLSDDYQENDASGSVDTTEAYQITDSSITITETSDTTETPSQNLTPPDLFTQGQVIVSGSFYLSVPSVVTLNGTASYSGLVYNLGYFSTRFDGYSIVSPDYSYTTDPFTERALLGAGNHTFSTSLETTSDFQSSNGSISGTGPTDLDLNVQLNVSQVQTTSTVISQDNPSIVGQSVTFDATVSAAYLLGAPIPTGNVTFYDGLAPLGTVALNINGNALLTTSLLTQGTHSITVAYDGDDTNSSSTSIPITQTVNDPAFIVPFGQFTFNSEIQKSPKASNFSQMIYYGGGDSSGVTIGAGYDLGSKTSLQALNDLEAAGVPATQAQEISEGAGDVGDDARQFVHNYRSSIGQITPEQQRQLFIIDYPRYVASVTMTYNDEYDEIGSGSTNTWANLTQSVKDVLVDFAYQNGMNSYTVTDGADAVIQNGKQGLIDYIDDTPKLSNEEQTKGPRQRINYLEGTP